MEEKDALSSFSALSHQDRLRIIRMLVVAGLMEWRLDLSPLRWVMHRRREFLFTSRNWNTPGSCKAAAMANRSFIALTGQCYPILLPS